MKVIVAQIGARHHYAIPQMLYSRGKLERLYTDFCAQRGAGLVLNRLLSLIPRRYRPKHLYKLARRQVVGVPVQKIYTVDRLLMEYVRQQLAPRDTLSHLKITDEIFSKQIIKAGVGNATTVYSMFGEGRSFLKHARSRGIRIVVDVYITPITHKIMHEEQAQFSDWEDVSYFVEYDEGEARFAELIDLADVLLCPSATVVDGLRYYPNFKDEKAKIVPYGSGITYDHRVNQPAVGRVLFAGSADLRKGIHYLAEAATLCRQRDNRYDFRVAGHVADRIRLRPECANLNFLGHLPKPHMIEEFMSADVFVLPTLAEGSASVIFEALTAGVPVVTTHSAGSVATHGVEGLIVPERDPHSLADAIQEIVENRTRRDAMAQAARRTAQDHTKDKWAERLLAALEE